MIQGSAMLQDVYAPNRSSACGCARTESPPDAGKPAQKVGTATPGNPIASHGNLRLHATKFGSHHANHGVAVSVGLRAYGFRPGRRRSDRQGQVISQHWPGVALG